MKRFAVEPHYLCKGRTDMRNAARIAVLLLISLVPLTLAAQDLYMKDTPLDTGVEPNPDNGPMWVTEDIWVRISPDPSYQPYPFAENAPPWVPLAHENPEFRDPKFSVPNYVYVRVRNRGNAASTGTERLRLYMAKASTGLAWPTQWVDYVANNCGPSKLFGIEVTKPRKNAATATPAERTAYINAITSIGTLPQFVFFGGVNYWLKQDDVHQSPVGPPNRHGTAAFLPWHREFVNRYEVLLQEADPTVKLLYWDWTTDPENSTGGFNFFTPSFMGASGRGAGLSGVTAGLPFIPSLAPPDDGDINRRLEANPPPAQSDATTLGQALYPSFRNLESNSHNGSHTYIGGFDPNTFAAIGDMSAIGRAAEDPFFFLLHGDVDRLWAQWQRNPAQLGRLDPATVFGAETGNVNITTSMRPWDGNPTTADPWTIAGGYIVSKLPSSPSVVSPPIYDLAPLTIPPLQPGQAVVIQIPWYPPNPADFSCFGGDQGHFCLLARIETSTTSPFGMTALEGNNVYANTKANNNIVWKNVTVVDNFAGALTLTSILIRNPFKQGVNAALQFRPARDTGTRFAEAGRVFLDLGPKLFERWREGGGEQKGIRVVGERGRVEIVDPEGAMLRNIKLAPDEVFNVDVLFELRKDYRVQPGFRPKFDLVQLGTPERPDAIVGGQRFEADYQKLVLVPARDRWRYLDSGLTTLDRKWTAADFDDSKWKIGKAELGYGDDPETTIARARTAYFRHLFDVADPSIYRDLQLRLKRDDGAIVYLNGREVHRVNLPADAGPLTPATAAVTGADEETFFSTPLSTDLLRAGRNVVAVELHQFARNDDASFDLELSANRAVKGTAPTVMFLTPPNGSLWRVGEAVPVRIDAVDPDGGKIRSVQLLADGKRVAASEQAPFAFRWTAADAGPHRLRAVAAGADQQSASADVTVNVVRNVPPAAKLTQPADNAAFEPGETIVATAEAADRDGKVDRVEFWIREAEFFGSKDRLIATAKERPFIVQLRDLKPGMYMLMAVAVDDGGERSESMPVHLIVRGADEHEH
jgi:Common central domain of tyrosinase/Bacterial Ig domain